jgi:hypothetical protein
VKRRARLTYAAPAFLAVERAGQHQLPFAGKLAHVGEVALEHGAARPALGHLVRAGFQDHQHLGAHAAFVGAEGFRQT